MSSQNACRPNTVSEFKSSVQWRAMTTVAAVLFLIMPTMLCAMPMTSMNVAEHECCKQMRNVDDCSKANMSSCCVTIPTDTGLMLPELGKKSPVSSPVEADVALPSNVFQAPAVFSPLIRTITYGSPSPPDSSCIQVLRI